jgi:hypothetical protein
MVRFISGVNKLALQLKLAVGRNSRWLRTVEFKAFACLCITFRLKGGTSSQLAGS